MNQSQFNKLGMYENVQLVFSENSSAVAALRSLKTTSDYFDSIVAGIYGAGQRQSAKSGIADQKRDAKRDLVSQADEIASITHAAAVEAGLTDLAGRTNYSFTRIFKRP